MATAAQGAPIERWVACTVQNHWGGGKDTAVEALEECYASYIEAGSVTINGVLDQDYLHKGTGISVQQNWSLTHMAINPPQDFVVRVSLYCGPGAITAGEGRCRCDWDSAYKDYFWDGSRCVNIPCPSGSIRDTSTGMCIPVSGCPVGSGCKSIGQSSCTAPATGNPITVSVGNKFLRETDISRLAYSFVRTYNSDLATVEFRSAIERSQEVGANFGIGWVYSFERRILVPNRSADLVWAIRPTGQQLRFVWSNGDWHPDADIVDHLTEVLDGEGQRAGWQYANRHSQEIEHYDADGLLQSISSSQGKIVFVYADGTDGLNSGQGGVLLDESGNPTIHPIPAGKLIRITDTQSSSLHIDYDDEVRISRLKQPDGEHVSFAYDNAGNLISVTYPNGNIRRYIYGEVQYTSGVSRPYALTGIIDANGIRYATYWYDVSGRAYDEQLAGDVDRAQLVFGTDANGNATTSVTDALGASRQYTFEDILGVQRMTSQSQPAGAGCNASTSALSYDPNGNVATRTDFDGAVTTYTYDLTRNLETSRVEASGTPEARTLTTDWHPDWHLKTRLAEPKLITTWVYNGQPDPVSGGTASCAPSDAEVIPGLPIAVVCSKIEQPTTDANGAQGFSATVDGDARVWTYTYNRYGKVLTADGPRSDVADVWTYEYYAADATCPGAGEGTGMDKGCRGELMRATDPVGLITEYVKYNAHGQVLQMRAPNGVLSTYTYDLRQRLTSQSVGALLTAFDYDPRGLLERVTLPDGSAIAYAYDAAHRLTGITQAATGERIEYTLDNAGNRTAETVFDAQGQIARHLAREFDALGRLWREIRTINGQMAATDYLHDAEDRLTHEINPLSETRQWQYNALGNLKAEIDALNATTHIVPDANGQTEAVVAANGAQTSFLVNGLGQVLFEGSPDRGNTSYGYDEAGNLVSRTFANGITEVRTYDPASRPRSTRYVKGDTTYWRQFDYQWDAKGQLSWLKASGGNMKFEYDALGRVTRNTFSVIGPYLNVDYTYDNVGRLTRMTYPSGRMLDIGYDAAGRIDNLAMAPYQLLSGVIYHPFGPVKQMTLLNGLMHTRELDANGLPHRITLGGITTDYGYDLAGRITTLDDTSGSAYDQSFGYDAAGRITGYNGHPGPRGYTYDANGNRTSDTIAGMVTDIVMRNNSNRIKTIGGKGVSYAADGAVLKYDGLNLQYNVEGKLLNVNLSDGRVNYRYDGLGRRVGKVLTNTSVLPYNIKYAYDLDNHLIGEYKADGTPIREYVWLGDLPIAVLDSNPDGTTSAYAIETDHLGTPRLLTDATQQPRWRWTSPPFGEVLPDENPSGLGAVTFNLRFPGQYYDKESGLNYNYHRYYQAETGRYVQSDPIGLDGGWNTFAYVGGNPVLFADPRGLDAVCGTIGFAGTPGRMVPCPPPPQPTEEDLCQLRCTGALISCNRLVDYFPAAASIASIPFSKATKGYGTFIPVGVTSAAGMSQSGLYQGCSAGYEQCVSKCGCSEK